MIQTASPPSSRSLSRQTVGLLLEMKRLLRRYDISIMLNASDAIERILMISAGLADLDIRECREQLLHAMLPLDRLYLVKHMEDEIACDRCGVRISVVLSAGADIEKPEVVRCTCGKQLQVAMEPRKHPRKSTQLEGVYLYESDRELTGEMTVSDLSHGGLCMRLEGPHSLVRHDRLLVVFTLDDLGHTSISEPARVLHVRGQALGIQFVNTQNRNKALTVYLKT
ncbi:MAG: PilZ domain-containing protein [Candidatus Tectomicrobia bacterium]|nr:PilZ domain-containing protein [Candidatus Tectomicrobia bacterium]